MNREYDESHDFKSTHRDSTLFIKCPDTSAIIASPDYTVTTLGGQNFLDSQGEVETNFGAGITQLQSDGTNWQQIN